MINSMIKDYQEKNESIPSKAVLAITGAIRGTSREKLYQELDLGSLTDRRWLRRLCYLHMVLSTKLPITSIN